MSRVREPSTTSFRGTTLEGGRVLITAGDVGKRFDLGWRRRSKRYAPIWSSLPDNDPRGEHDFSWSSVGPPHVPLEDRIRQG